MTQIKYVLCVAGSSSIREAASKLFVSQPALSSSIHDLEDELGILLFERTNKGIALTKEGRDFVTYAKKALNQYEILEDRFISKDKDKERFSVSTQHYNFAIRAFAELLKDKAPERYSFSLHETKTESVLDEVRNLKSEVGIVSFSGSGKEVMQKLFKDYRLEFTPLMTRDTYVYFWKDHPFAKRKEISLEELKDYPCISFDQDSDSNYYLTEEALADYDFEKLIKSDDRATTMELIAQLQGYSIGSGMLAGEDVILKGLVSVKLKEEDPLVIGYITRKDTELSEYGRCYVEKILKYKEK